MMRLFSRRSLRLNLLLRVMLPLAGVLSLTLWFSAGSASRQADRLNEQQLLASARVIAEQVRFENGRIRAAVPPSALELFASDSHDEVAYRVETVDGRLVVGFLDLPIPSASIRDFKYLFYPAMFRDETMRAIALRQPIVTPEGSTSVLVLVGETLKSRDALEWQLWLRAFVEQAGVVLVAAFLIWIGISRELRPLLALREAVLSRPADHLEPFDSDTVQLELHPLVEAINSHMARLLEVVGRQRRFLDAAAHQLRTPLAVMKTQIAYSLRAKAEEERRDALAAVGEGLDGMSRMTLQLLALARVENIRNLPPREVDMRALVREIVGSAVPRALDQGVALVVDASEPAPVMVRERLLRELVSNLVENAITHAGSGATATISLAPEVDRVVFKVEDDGEGPGEDDLSHLTRRFQRGANAASSGSGLGLSIVAEIADICKGELTLYRPASGKGFGARVVLPGP
ncbi:sensor histidine kinase [Allorhizobium sp. BGMRC 0089]|uniref:sensor histidine kinase n=1 Tax=Allorhizobium sonneratiae TaxID=2934936 RepID=UPI00203462B6|nr:sensor histidine kinase [Allorhizobium sonneratiae]MCM2294645.1 sensor histidine kinase [Allorhizobium sonneratiae]